MSSEGNTDSFVHGQHIIGEQDRMNHISSTNEKEINEIVYALSNFKGVGQHQLSFGKGAAIRVLEKPDDNWWWGEIDGVKGYIPVNHLTYESLQQMYWEDTEYFGNYGNLKIHHEMLSDRPRTLAYQSAIQKNAQQLRGKRVIDVGCGTGILSLMCAKYGLPSQIYAVEASDIVEHTKTIVEKNNLGETIQVIHGYAEELKLEERVDLIISEWMGTLLLFEMMIESVILTRDNLLKEKGMLWPSSANLFLVPCSAHAQYSQKMEFWDSQFGFDFSPLKPVAQQEFLHKPVHNHEMKPEDCLSSPVSVVFIDMKTVTVAELEHYTHHFSFQIQKDQVMHGFASWFQVTFDPLGHNNDVVILNTGPWHELTHWKQNLFLLDEPISIMEGEIITGSFELYRHKEWRRHLRVLLKFKKVPNEMKENWVTGTEKKEYEKLFHVWR